VDDDGQGDDAGSGKGVLLAVAILLVWLAGVCLWLAFEGTGGLPTSLPVGPGGKPSYVLGVLQMLAGRAQELEASGVQEQQDQAAQNSGGGG
jgi:hypothetical protein